MSLVAGKNRLQVCQIYRGIQMESNGLTYEADLTWTREHEGLSPNLDMASRKRVYSVRDRSESQKQLQFLEG